MPRLPPSRRLLPLLLACALAPALQAAPTLPPGVAAGPCVEGICEYRLPNGLRMLLFPDATRPTVTVNLTYGVGSVHENYGETGMAHLLEHLLFKGTPTHRDIPGDMRKRGIAYNATTSLDRTNYFGSFPADDATLDWLLALEADRMTNSFVAKKDLDSEMTVVRNELEAGENEPGRVLGQRVRAAAFDWHNYGNSTIGARSDVENVPIERLQAFYRAWYRPDNATLVIAGRIEPEAALARVVRHFGPLKRPATPLPAAYTVEPVQDGERAVTVRRRGDLQLLMLAYHVPAITHPDSAALAVLADVLGDVPGGRLHAALVEPRLAAGTVAGVEALRDAGLATIIAVAGREADAVKVEAELLRQVEALATRPVTADEVARARQRIENVYETRLTDVNAVAMGLTGALASGDWRLYFLQRDRIAKVTADDVNRVARAYLKPANRTLGRFVPTDAPDRAEIPVAPAAADALKGYSGRTAVSAGEAFEATLDNIEARTQVFTVGERLKVALLPKDTRGDTVTVQADFRFADAQALARGPHRAAGLVGAMLMRGARGLDRATIDARLTALRTQGGVSGGLQGASIDLLSRREHVGEALDLAARLLREPTFPEAEFEQLRLQAITGLDASRADPGSIAGRAMAEHFDVWPEGHPLRHRSLDETLADLRALTLDDVRRFHAAFYGTAEGEITVVGDFDPVEMRTRIETLFAGWRAPVPFAPIRTSHVDITPERERLAAPDKANAVVLARLNLPLNEADPDYPALLVASSILGGGTLKSRLGDRVRQKDGLSYGVSSSISADASIDGRDDAGALTIQAIAAPQNAERVEAAIREELARLVSGGVTADELRDAVSGLLTQRRQARASDATVAGMLARNLYLQRTLDFQKRVDAALAALTVDAVNAALRRKVRPERLSVYLAGDFDGAAPPATARSP
ncbi:M16 family metallopeptidase [Lysobacter humi (ex Lee et al. 2017)]